MVLDWKIKEEKQVDGRQLRALRRIDCLMHSPYSLFISRSQSPFFPLPHPHAGQLQARGEKKRYKKGLWRQTEKDRASSTLLLISLLRQALQRVLLAARVQGALPFNLAM